MEALLPNCTLIPNDDERSAKVYQLHLKNEFSDDKYKLRRLSFGCSNAPMKTILVMGETGSGKSTLINSLANYLFGVKFEDEHRFRLVNEDHKADQTKSVTDWVTAYVLYHQDTFPKEFPFSLKIVDTPGFGDTAGRERDNIITKQLTKFFTTEGTGEIHSLDALCFVVKDSTTRLTEREKYIFNSVLWLFGIDIGKNIVPFLTFADQSGLCSEGICSRALDAMKADEISYKFAITCNNSDLFQATKNYQKRQKQKKSIQWEEREESYETLFTELCALNPVSLWLTKDVLRERERLKTQIIGIRKQVADCLKKQELLHENKKVIKENEKLIVDNENYKTELKEQIRELVAMRPGEFAQICLDCEITCHKACRCGPANLWNWACDAMSSWTPFSNCTVCPDRCSWTRHTVSSRRYQTRTVSKWVTSEEMKIEFEKASKEKFTTQGFIAQLENEIEEHEFEKASKEKFTTQGFIAQLENEIEEHELHTVYLLETVRVSLEKLDKIAMRPCTMKTTEQFVNSLIEEEKSKGNEDAVLQYQKILEYARRLKANAESEGITDIAKTVDDCIERGLEADEKPKNFVIKMFKDIKNMLPGWGNKYKNSAP